MFDFFHTQFIASKSAIGKKPKAWVVNNLFSLRFYFPVEVQCERMKKKIVQKMNMNFIQNTKNYIVLVDEWNGQHVHRTSATSSLWAGERIQISMFNVRNMIFLASNGEYVIYLFRHIIFTRRWSMALVCMCHSSVLLRQLVLSTKIWNRIECK